MLFEKGSAKQSLFLYICVYGNMYDESSKS